MATDKLPSQAAADLSSPRTLSSLQPEQRPRRANRERRLQCSTTSHLRHPRYGSPACASRRSGRAGKPQASISHPFHPAVIHGFNESRGMWTGRFVALTGCARSGRASRGLCGGVARSLITVAHWVSPYGFIGIFDRFMHGDVGGILSVASPDKSPKSSLRRVCPSSYGAFWRARAGIGAGVT